MEKLYPCANTRKCYWDCLGCLKGYSQCSMRCPDYLSIARVKRLKESKKYSGTATVSNS